MLDLVLDCNLAGVVGVWFDPWSCVVNQRVSTSANHTKRGTRVLLQIVFTLLILLLGDPTYQRREKVYQWFRSHKHEFGQLFREWSNCPDSEIAHRCKLLEEERKSEAFEQFLAAVRLINRGRIPWIDMLPGCWARGEIMHAYLLQSRVYTECKRGIWADYREATRLLLWSLFEQVDTHRLYMWVVEMAANEADWIRANGG